MIPLKAVEIFQACLPARNFQNLQSPIIALMIAVICFVWGYPVQESQATPKAEEVLKELSFSDRQYQQILQGEIIQWTTKEASHRELAMGMVLLVKDDDDSPAFAAMMFDQDG